MSNWGFNWDHYTIKRAEREEKKKETQVRFILELNSPLQISDERLTQWYPSSSSIVHWTHSYRIVMVWPTLWMTGLHDWRNSDTLLTFTYRSRYSEGKSWIYRPCPFDDVALTHIKNGKLGLKLCVDESQPTICCGMCYPSDARNAKGLEFLLYQLAFRIKRGIRWFQCWYGIRAIREFNFSVFDYPNGEF